MTFDDDHQRVHREVWQLIPWWVNGTASADDRRACERHLQDCPDCRDEVDLQSRIRAGLADDGAPLGHAQAAFARLLERIDAEPPTIAPSARPSRSPAERWWPGLVAAVVVQAVGLVALAAFALHRTPAAPAYATLSVDEAERPGATIRLVPARTLTIGALHDLLAQNGLRIVDGQRDRPIYALSPTRPIDATATLARLRAHADILLAEPIVDDAH